MKTIAFDLDDTLCTRSSNEGAVEKYNTCEPIDSMIKIVNDLYDKGYRIIIYTARGMTSFKGNKNKIEENLYSLTLEQLERWNVKFHQLVMGKEHYDILIDDKVVNSTRIKNKEDIETMLWNMF